jgi:PmbA protein
MSSNGTELAEWVLERARKSGASAAEVLIVSGEGLAAAVRLGRVEKLKSSRDRRVGIRVFTGQSAATASTAEFERDALAQFVDETVELARLTAPDPWSGLPDPKLHPKHLPELELADSVGGRIDADRALARARETEEAALALDPRIKNSEGAEFDCGSHQVLFANSQGFSGQYGSTAYSLSVAPVAQDGDSMQRDHWYSVSRRYDQLESGESVGRIAAARALRRLGARKIKTTRAPVVFDPDMAAGLIRSLVGAACGPSLYKGASFLLNKLGQEIASPRVTIIDDALMRGGLGSKPFDGEGLATRRQTVVDKGILATYLLDTYSARKLKLESTGSASRGIGDSPGVSPTNLYLEPGSYKPEEIIASVEKGLFVTELIGFGVNSVTGDYSRGASGIWIENGKLTYPCQEITIAGNLKEMFLSIEMVGNDLTWKSSVVSPTLKISEMTIAGS